MVLLSAWHMQSLFSVMLVLCLAGLVYGIFNPSINHMLRGYVVVGFAVLSFIFAWLVQIYNNEGDRQPPPPPPEFETPQPLPENLQRELQGRVLEHPLWVPLPPA